MYDALLYGSEDDKADMPFLDLDGTLFDSKQNEFMFFEDVGLCFVCAWVYMCVCDILEATVASINAIRRHVLLLFDFSQSHGAQNTCPQNYAYTHKHTLTHAHTFPANAHTKRHAHAHTHTHTLLNITYTHTYIHKYTHMHTHTHPRKPTCTLNS
jgi:hypothetical protein